MVWHALLQSTNVMSLALIPTTTDRIVVWGAVALVIGLIAWREYTLPDISAPDREPSRKTQSASQLASANLVPGVVPAAALPEVAEPRPVA